MAHSFDENKVPIIHIIEDLKPSSIFDIGIGAGDYGPLIKLVLPNVFITGMDIWTEYENDQWKYYNDIVICDMREFNFPKVDLTLFIDSLEHVKKSDAFGVLSKIDGKILVSIPINYKQPKKLDKYDKHLSEWTIEDFKNYKYEDFSNERSLILLLYGKLGS